MNFWDWTIFFTVLLVFNLSSLSQRPVSRPLPDSSLPYSPALSNICSNEKLLSELRKDPVFRAEELRMNTEIRNASSSLTGGIITIPVVFHIVNQNPATITDAFIQNALQNLNDAFSKSGPYAASAGVDTEIRFCLAQKDPDGGNTTGISRTKSYFSTHLNKDIEDARLKNLIQWDPAQYVNIWYIASIDAEAFADFSCGTWYRLGVGGYATMPPGGGPLDGIVVTAFGPLLAHEMGHYLGLYHTFEGGCQNNNCQTDGDRVCDTPPDATVRPSGSCGSPTNSCTSDTLSSYSNGNFPVDVPDQVSNFMDYGNGACSNRFTQGQADRMRAAIQTQRTGLLEDKCVKPCADNLVAAFVRNNAYPLPGDNINFTNQSSITSNYEWLINNAVISTATDFSHTFPAPGKYKVTLKAFNAAGCFASYSDFIVVTCGVTARFYTNKQTIASKIDIYTDTILFKNNSENATSFQWLMSNSAGMAEQVVSTSIDLNYVFPTPALYRIRLVATNGSCSDTTAVYTATVLDPTADGVPFGVTISCFANNKVRLNFCLADFGFAPLRKNTEVNFYDKDPRQAGANRLLPTFKLTSDVPGGNCTVCFTTTLDVDYTGLEKIFVVYNDSGISVPVMLPNTWFVEKNYANNFTSSPSTRFTVNASICEGQSYLGYSKAGTYYDTLRNAFTGCDNIRTLNLAVRPVYAVTITTSICEGENYAGHTRSGTYIDLYTARNGCDSTRTLHLTVKPIARSTVSATICEYENYSGHTKTGTYTDVYKATNGCDSTRILHLTVNPKKVTTINHTMCQGGRYFAAGVFQTTTGIYYDTLRTYLNCDSIVVTNLTVNPLPSPDLGKDRGVCIGDTLTLNPGSFISYFWQDGSSGSNFRTNRIGTYSVSVTNNFGCTRADTMRVLAIDPLPANFLPPDTSLCRGNVLTLQVPGYVSYHWNTSGNRWFLDVTASGMYRLEVTDRNGCTGADSLNAFFYTDCIIIEIPNAFTPNNDGKNDRFIPFMPAPLPNYHFQIFNRWGQLVFDTKDTKRAWNGYIHSTLQPAGTYVYQLSFNDFDGKPMKRSGAVFLIR